MTDSHFNICSPINFEYSTSYPTKTTKNNEDTESIFAELVKELKPEKMQTKNNKKDNHNRLRVTSVNNGIESEIDFLKDHNYFIVNTIKNTVTFIDSSNAADRYSASKSEFLRLLFMNNLA